jgi:Zinc knuckle
MLGLKNQNHHKKDPNTMDVDQGQISFTKLTNKEKATLKSRGACFRCRQDGHVARNCPKNGSAKYGRLAPTQYKAQEATIETPKEKDRGTDVYSLMSQVKDSLKTNKDKQKFFDAMVDQGFV